jgi:hypothetical protein
VLQGKKSSRKYFISGRHEYFALHNFLALDLSGSDKNDFIIVSSTLTWGLGFNIWREGQIKFKVFNFSGKLIIRLNNKCTFSCISDCKVVLYIHANKTDVRDPPLPRALGRELNILEHC